MAESSSQLVTILNKVHAITTLATDEVDMADIETASAVRISSNQQISVLFNEGEDQFTVGMAANGKIDLDKQAITSISITNPTGSTATVSIILRRVDS